MTVGGADASFAFLSILSTGTRPASMRPVENGMVGGVIDEWQCLGAFMSGKIQEGMRSGICGLMGPITRPVGSRQTHHELCMFRVVPESLAIFGQVSTILLGQLDCTSSHDLTCCLPNPPVDSVCQKAAELHELHRHLPELVAPWKEACLPMTASWFGQTT